MAKHSLVSRIIYQTKFKTLRLFSKKPLDGVSILLVTWNRARFLDVCFRTLADTVPAEYEILLLDNHSCDDTAEVIKKWQNRLHLRVFRIKKNIGMSGYAALALHARYRWLIEMDDDILVLPKNWYERMTDAFAAFPDLGYLGLDVVQDIYTTGAKPEESRYQNETRNSLTVQFGPVGGWCTMTPREVYNAAGGLPFRPHKPYFSEDAYYMRELGRIGKRFGILQGVRAYHACGATWNAAYGYMNLLEAKYRMPGGPPLAADAFTVLENARPDLSMLDQYR